MEKLATPKNKYGVVFQIFDGKDNDLPRELEPLDDLVRESALESWVEVERLVKRLGVPPIPARDPSDTEPRTYGIVFAKDGKKYELAEVLRAALAALK